MRQTGTKPHTGKKQLSEEDEMKHHNPEEHDAAPITYPAIGFPSIVPPTPEELARRRGLFDEIARIREHIGPIGTSAVELIDADFYELDDGTK